MKKAILIIIIGVILSIGGGFFIGHKVSGSPPIPGSIFDPLVTQSYAQKSVDDRIKTLEDKLAELELKTQVLENELLALQDKNGLPSGSGSAARPTSPSSPSSPSAPTMAPTSPSSAPTAPAPTVSQAVPVDVVGKTASISSGNSVVNMRQGPNTSSTVLRKLGPSDTFTIVKVDKDWYQVQMSDGTTGWVAGWLVTAK
jgi:hypothetical protein